MEENFLQNADFFSAQLSKVHEYYFKAKTSSLLFKHKSSRSDDEERVGGCLKNGFGERAGLNTSGLIVHYSTHTCNDDDDGDDDL